jgi:hypothetical protein
MPSEIIHRKKAAKARFGNPGDSEWHKGIHEGRYPAPDVKLGKQTPGWTDSHIEHHQKALREAAAEGREQRAEHGRALRRGERRKPGTKPVASGETTSSTA